MDKGVGQFVLEHVLQLGSHAAAAGDRNAQLAIVNAAGPGGSLGYVEELGVGVENDGNVFAGRVIKLAPQIAILIFQRVEQVALQSQRSLGALVAQNKMPAIALDRK